MREPHFYRWTPVQEISLSHLVNILALGHTTTSIMLVLQTLIALLVTASSVRAAVESIIIPTTDGLELTDFAVNELIYYPDILNAAFYILDGTYDRSANQFGIFPPGGPWNMTTGVVLTTGLAHGAGSADASRSTDIGMGGSTYCSASSGRDASESFDVAVLNIELNLTRGLLGIQQHDYLCGQVSLKKLPFRHYKWNEMETDIAAEVIPGM